VAKNAKDPNRDSSIKKVEFFNSSHKKVEWPNYCPIKSGILPKRGPSRAIRIPKLSDLWTHPLGLRQSAPGWEILDFFMAKYGNIIKLNGAL
jgi:hypothetical protein